MTFIRTSLHGSTTMKGLVKISTKTKRVVSLLILAIALVGLFIFSGAILAKIVFVLSLAICVLTMPETIFQKSAGKRAALRKVRYQKK
ncbi:hypothetical protein [Liquorilactobacillus sucicola]|nr:hypothetical protein [Liquorilactobacillus sucicola]